MERYADKYVITKKVKFCYDSREYFDDDEWSSPICVAIVDSYNDAKDFIANKNNYMYHLKRLDDESPWELHPDSNENHRGYYSIDEQEPFEKRITFVKFNICVVPYYK